MDLNPIIVQQKMAQTLKRKPEVVAGPHHGSSVRLNKYLSSLGVTSRRKADEMILAGRIKVNGRTARELGIRLTRKKTRWRSMVEG